MLYHMPLPNNMIVQSLAAALLLVAGQTNAAIIRIPEHPQRKEHFGSNPNAQILFAAPPIGNRVDRQGWRVTCDSEQNGNECAKAIDGDNNSIWHTNYDGPDGGPRPPHSITIDMGSSRNINGLSALPRQDDNYHGFIARHDVSVSQDGSTWESIASGAWHGDKTEKYANFETRVARYVRLTAISEFENQPWTSVAELNLYESQNGPTRFGSTGKWGPTINFPTVPVAGTIDPITGKLIIWSAYAYDQYGGSPGDRVFTASWDPATGEVNPRLVDNTKHDMFCPGISIDGMGNMVVTGGNSAKKTTLYDFASGQWIAGPDMNAERGYQSSAVCSDGRVFTVGGSWSGPITEKNGEIYDPRRKTWTNLPRARVNPMLTKDQQGLYRSDNHAWLFGWKNGTVFQAGPSTDMNWFYTNGNGDTKPAGKRQSDRGVDNDSMNGNAVMFDAVNGKILAFGGSPSYQDSGASASAHLITIGEPGRQADVRFASNGLWFSRVFHTAVVLPDGKVFITGGQSYAKPFEDTNVQLTPEIYDPVNDNFIQQQPNSIIRVYHSISVLMPDGRVFTGGGGLCGDCKTNHFDGQLFTPQYLLNNDGSSATRPVIQSASLENGRRRVRITVDSEIKSASLIRYGTATHTVNTDQRRIPLNLVQDGGAYTADLPTDPGILIPGYYMLFVMNANGVPSVSRTINLLLS